MRSRTFNSRLLALLPALALAAYGVVGVFGHALHGLLPCADGHCGTAFALADAGEEHECCCHLAAPKAASENGGPQYRSAGHDANNCSLCLLLAKVKSARVPPPTIEIAAGACGCEPTLYVAEPSAALLQSAAPRGPPAC